MADAALVDPLGRRIVLHDRTWFGHIIKGHSEMGNHRVLAERAVDSRTKFASVGPIRIAGYIMERAPGLPLEYW